MPTSAGTAKVGHNFSRPRRLDRLITETELTSGGQKDGVCIRNTNPLACGWSLGGRRPLCHVGPVGRVWPLPLPLPLRSGCQDLPGGK